MARNCEKGKTHEQNPMEAKQLQLQGTINKLKARETSEKIKAGQLREDEDGEIVR